MAVDQFEMTKKLETIFLAHGISCGTEKEWVLPNRNLPAIRAVWHPGEESGRLDVHVLVEKGILIEECFAGVGNGQKAFNDAIQNFMVNSLHVLLAAFWGMNDPDQVVTERWYVGKKHFTAYIGNIGTRASAGVSPFIPSELVSVIQSAAENELLPDGVHWVRVFFCNVAGQQTYEVLLDNEPWLPGLSAVKAIQWQHSNGYYSGRNFIVLRSGA
jgi:hypothetical protein